MLVHDQPLVINLAEASGSTHPDIGYLPVRPRSPLIRLRLWLKATSLPPLFQGANQTIFLGLLRIFRQAACVELFRPR